MKSNERRLLRGFLVVVLAFQASACGVLGDLFGGGGRDQDSEVDRMVYVRGDAIHSSWLRTARLKILQEEGSYGSPTWSPNGRDIAFLSVDNVALTDTLTVMNEDPGRAEQRRNLSADSGRQSQPASARFWG